ncbi:MAG: hypothetical protein HXK70_04820 [Clostridiales bacterium]|nr:hypothetical protein [Clostridiales bacterium]
MLKERLYDESNSEVESFQLVLGYISGYNIEELERKNEFDSIERFNALYYQVAQEIYNKSGVFVTALTYKSRVLYPDCPEGGERVYIIQGSRNEKFTPEPQKYQDAVNLLAMTLASKLKQETYSIAWSNTTYSYFKKE